MDRVDVVARIDAMQDVYAVMSTGLVLLQQPDIRDQLRAAEYHQIGLPMRRMTPSTRIWFAMTGGLLVAATACAGPQGKPSAAGASPDGARAARCADVVKPGSPVTERLLAEGCAEPDGSVTTFNPFLCRLQGYTAINYRDEVVAIELDLDPEPPRPSAPPDRVYGSWAEPMTAPDADATGCINPDSVPDPVGPS